LIAILVVPCLAEDIPAFEGSKDGVTLRVACQKSFSSNREVEIGFVVLNRSDSKYGLMVPSDVQDTRIQLCGPDGREIVGYQEKDGWLFSWSLKRRFLAELKPGQDFEGDPVSLSTFWPLRQVGEYRCRMTKRLYRAEKLEGEPIGISNRGTPVEIESAEFTFGVEAIDPTFKSSLDPDTFSKRVASDVEQRIMSPWRWVVCISLALALLGILLRRLAALKAPPQNGA
jgi:hypothetical protein